MDRSGIPPSSRLHWILALWLSGVFALGLAARMASLDPLFVLPIALSWPLIVFALSLGRRESPIPVIGSRMPVREALLVTIVLFSALSIVESRQTWHSIAYWVFELVGFCLAYTFARRLDADGYIRGFTLYVLLMLPILTGFALYDYEPGTRLGQHSGVLNPNAIALVSVSVAVMAALVTNRLLRGLALSIAFGVIYLTGSRASLFAALTAWSVIIAFGIARRGLVGLLAVLFTLAGGIVLALAYGSEIVAAVSNILALSDPYRGLGTGLTGRLEAWRETWDLAMAHPATGVGLRAHESLIQSSSSAHNGYLSTLAEIGIIGFSATMALIASSVVSLARFSSDLRWSRLQTVLFGLVAGYLVLALFERYLINLGNPTSLIFLLALFFTRPRETIAENEHDPVEQVPVPS